MVHSKPQPASNSKVLVFGAGNFGSCLASHLGDSQHDVYMWAREERIVKHFNLHHRNPSYLTHHAFPTNITAVGPQIPDKKFINNVDVLLFAIPTQFLRATLQTLRPSLNVDNLPLLIFVNKGIEVGTNALTLEIIADTCGPDIAKAATFISGPSFAKEIVERQPTSVSVASFTEVEATKAATLFHQPHFRCYTGVDPIGIELSGALKNVYAIASGMSDGLGFENNTRAMIITRGLSEMTCIGTAYGASPLTFLGLAGVGDLFLTCSSSNSRNYTVGYRLGKGEKLDVIIETLGSVAEGVATTKGAKKIIEELGVHAPIASSVYEVLFNGKDTRVAVRELMELPPSRELELPPTAGGPARRLLAKLGLEAEELKHLKTSRYQLIRSFFILIDQAGVTPLIEAVRNGRVDAVRILLEKGANPLNPSSQGPPESYTSDPAILELLQAARNKATANENAAHQAAYEREGEHPEKPFYAPPQPDAYTYYPTINPSLSTVNESGVYYPSSQPHVDGSSPNGLGNLPPPEIAKLIPCRYYPACRYGAQCMFAHPQAPYFQGPMPPVPYPPYDSMGHQYVPPYYPSPPNFQPPPPPPPAGHPMSPPPVPPVMHARTPSEVVSPSLGQFSPNGAPPPVPYGPLSPPVYPHPGQVPVGIQPIPPLPPLHPHAPHAPPPPNMYNPSPVPPYPAPQEAPSGPYPLPVPPSNANFTETNGVHPPEPAQAENFNPQANARDGGNGHRRGSGRRPSFGARKPPCLFFPSGRCKNGDDCRFPHVLPDNGGVPTQPSFAPPRGAPRARAHVNGPNGLGNIESKFGNMSVRDDNTRQRNGVEGSSRSHSSDAGNRPKFQQGPKQPNGINGNKKVASTKPQPQQRVPRADEFPVLGGTVTPPRVNGAGHNGPTAAQVLQAPPPARKEGSKEPSTRGASPDLTSRGNTAKVRTHGSELIFEDSEVSVAGAED
ncbi:hypothetical protein CVT26_002029 [Gymnopilus dilepis]|uniref:Glycerol-3-phosphate dehydrogenase [NAD(+)] n=1 Tax=Gymnopilus dilepis TaxID=231916 RepID=A0A409VEJ7_9AGAR|nr:hypothetical protein CVT26_002029 [Gymnopilus dilepis]